MAQSTNIGLNYFAYAGYTGEEAVEGFKVFRAYESNFSGRSVIRTVKGIIKSSSGNPRVLNERLGKMVGKTKPLNEILNEGSDSRKSKDLIKYYPSSELDHIVLYSHGRAHLEENAERSYLEDGNTLGDGLYAHARRAREESGNPAYEQGL